MWEYNYTQDNNELCHYGVPGMKWGKRKAKTEYKSKSIKSALARKAKKQFKKDEKSKEKASEFATKKRVDIGKKKIDSILSESRKKSFESTARTESALKDKQIRDKYGDNTLNAYKNIQGKS